MKTFLQELKDILEFTTFDLMDDKLLLLANSNLALLANSGVPVITINENSTKSDFLLLNDQQYLLTLEYVTNKILLTLNFDVLSNTSYTILKEITETLLQTLKWEFYNAE